MTRVFRFDDFELDEARRELRRNGEVVEVRRSVPDVLLYLVRERNRVVPKEELIKAVWPTRRVSDQALFQTIHIARTLLQDDAEHQTKIQALRGRGYRFVGSVDESWDGREGGADPSSGILSQSDFVGRERELQAFDEALGEALQGQMRMVLVAGEAGIGKTRSTDEFATRARHRGAEVHPGRCYEGQGAPAFWPWVQILRHQIEERDLESLGSLFSEGAADLARIFPELRDVNPSAFGSELRVGADSRFQAFENLVEFWRRLTRERPLVLVLDDLHWADLSSLVLLQFVAQALSHARLLIVGTFRPAEMERDPARANLIRRLQQHPAARSLELSGFSPDEVRRFVAGRVGGTVDGASATALYERTEGNPFFLTHLIPLVTPSSTAGEQASVSPGESLPRTVREVIVQQLANLPIECRNLLGVAAVAGRDFRLRVLQEASGVSDVVHTLSPAVSAGIVREDPDQVGLYRFTHVLVRDALYDELGFVNRAQLHRSVGEALEAMSGEELGENVVQLAYHFFEGAPGADTWKATEYTVQAGDWLAIHMAYEEAAVLYQRALELVKQRGQDDDLQICDLLLKRGGVQVRAGDREGARASLEQAAVIARRLKSPERLALAALALSPGFLSIEVGVTDRGLVAMLEEALSALDDEGSSTIKVHVLARLGIALRYSQLERAVLLSKQALSMAEKLGDPLARIVAINADLIAGGQQDMNVGKYIVGSVESLRLACEYGDPELELFARAHRIGGLFWRAEMGELDREIAEYGEFAERLRQPQSLWYREMFAATRSLMSGDLIAAEDHGREALAIGLRVQDINAAMNFAGVLAVARWHQGRIEELLPVLQSNINASPGVMAWVSALALAYAELGRNEECLKEVEVIVAGGLHSKSLWAPAAVLLSHALALVHDSAHAPGLYHMLLPHARHFVTAGMGGVCLGSGSRALGMLASSMGRWNEAEEHFDLALKFESRAGAHLWLPHTQLGYAQMLLMRGRPADRSLADSLVRQVHRSGVELNLPRLVERAADLSQQLGGNLPRRPNEFVGETLQLPRD